MEYEAIQAFFTVILAICGGIVCIAGACTAVVKFWRWAHKDTDKNTDTIEEFMTWFASDKRRIEELERKQEGMIEINKIQLQALRAILQHEIDGNNHSDDLKRSLDDIDKYLVDKSVK